MINEYRFLRLEHISRLTGRSEKRLHRRIFRLLSQGYLKAITFPQQKHIYALAKRAVPVLVEQGIAYPDLLAERLRNHELKDLFLKHEILIVDIHAVLSLATAGAGILRLVTWREGRGLFDSVEVSDHTGGHKLPVRPDALFILEDSRRSAAANRAHFFLEADRSTETQARFRDKIRAHWHYLEQGLHTKKFGIKHFREFTVTLTRGRAENLCALAASFLPDVPANITISTRSKTSRLLPGTHFR